MLLLLGLLTRAASIVLLGTTTMIEVFVYPQAWPTHIQWAAMLLILICRGPGKLSIDHLLWRHFRHRQRRGAVRMTPRFRAENFAIHGSQSKAEE